MKTEMILLVFVFLLAALAVGYITLSIFTTISYIKLYKEAKHFPIMKRKLIKGIWTGILLVMIGFAFLIPLYIYLYGVII